MSDGQEVQEVQTMSRRSLLAYIFRILLSSTNLTTLRKLIYRKRKFDLSTKFSDSIGIVYLNPLVCFAKGIVEKQIVQITFTITLNNSKVKAIRRFMAIRPEFSLHEDEVRIGKMDYYNIIGRNPIKSLAIESITVYSHLPDSKKELSVADSIRVARIRSFNSSTSSEALDDDLQKLIAAFRTPTVFYNHDVIAVLVGDIFTKSTRHAFFRIDCSSSPCIVYPTTSIYQTTALSTFLPFGGRLSEFPLPTSLRQLIDRMTSIYHAHSTVSSTPLPLFLSGPSGSGKRLIASCLATSLHLNLIEVSCYDSWREVTIYDEFRNTLERAESSQPCILHLTHVDVLGYNSMQTVIDNRIINLLKTFLAKSLNVVVIFSCNSDQLSSLSSALTSLALYDHTIPILTSNDRNEFLLSSKIAHDVTIFASQHTSGFNISELCDLIRDASFRANQLSLPNECSQLPKEAFEWAIDKRNANFADAIGAPKIPSVSWDDVGGMEETKQIVKESIAASLKGKAKKLRRSGVILYGPPGCGKTLIAKAVATEYKIAFLSVKGPELLNKYIGQSEENVRKVFERAKQAAPCVVFFDELDSLASSRGKHGDSGGVTDRIVSQLLAELDDLHSSPSCAVFVMGATNRADLLDPSLMTPGRFDKLINVAPGQGVEAKAEILKAVCRSLSLADDVDLLAIASECGEVMSGAQLYSLVSMAAMHALREEVKKIESDARSIEDKTKVKINQRHLHLALETLKNRA